MRGKPIRVDWDDLESAFNNRSQELVYYLDLVTGHVHLQDEGESDEDDPATAGPTATHTRVLITPPDEDIEVSWAVEFVDSADEFDEGLENELRQALDDDDPLDAFREALRDRDEIRAQWFLFRSDQVHVFIDDWLAANDVPLAEPPPWR